MWFKSKPKCVHSYKVVGISPYIWQNSNYERIVRVDRSTKYSTCVTCGIYEAEVICIPVDLLAVELNIPKNRIFKN
jgi:hypothetical protein